ncbi:FAD/NAD-P-binding domain-containing protein [Epithele typhae]|uniref:FAD/NAD-P-binding domain-containing protein n=1 Tax=Epithele typhae TaxID=378194 RepID=UPI002008230C|nr:FAD/NAD-P-binding domain-containing protein [Epithele typhae]KAH9939410.1 FAD/NAD-P-binding domain-containing protein [Epithele typhae]
MFYDLALGAPDGFMGDEIDLLSIDFVIAGGSLCGLSAAIALRRVGHNVVVVDRTSPYEPTKFDSGIRLPPNSTKHYYRWGLKDRLQSHAVSVKSQGTLFASFHSGSIVGEHSWESSILEELGGDTLFMHYTQLRKLLAEHATEIGPSLKLESDEVLIGDVVLGADGYILEGNLCRTALFNANIPEANLDRLEDKEMLVQLRRGGKVFTWYGRGYGALGFPVKSITGEDAFTLYIFTPRAEMLERPYRCEIEECLAALKDSDPRLRQIAKHASRITCVPMADHPKLEEWVHPDGRLLCIGEGAHPTPVRRPRRSLPRSPTDVAPGIAAPGSLAPAGDARPAILQVGSLFSVAMCTCDAACLGRLFSHLTRHDQIDTLLYALQEIREGPVASVFKAASGNIFATSLPPGIVERDDEDKRARAEHGLASLGGGIDSLTPESSPEMIEVVEQLFGYDAEDEADNWWVNWGLMQERATRREMFRRSVTVSGKDEDPEGQYNGGSRAGHARR